MSFQKSFKMGVLMLIAASLGFARPLPAFSGGQEGPDVVSIGQKIKIESKILGETREIWLRLPQGYENSQEKYPLLIQLGGGAHFLYSAGIVDILSRNDYIAKMVVAAVTDPTPRHHYRDSTPTKVDYLPDGGGASKFLQFLKEELLPALGAGYRLQPFRILCGHGLSGMFAVYALLESPGAFGAIITDGASLTYDDSFLLKRIESLPAGAPLSGSLYLGVGHELETIPGLERMAAHLKKAPPQGLDWTMQEENDEDQGTASLQVLYHGLKWLYRDWRLPVETARRGMEAVKTHLGALSKKFGYEFPLTAGVLSVRGFQLVREQRFDEAAALFEINVRTYPDLPDVYHNLAFLAERMKRWADAAAYYEKAAEKAGSQPGLAQFFKGQAEQAKRRIKRPD